MIEETTLDARVHDRLAFTCGAPAHDEYFRRLAAQQTARGITVVRVLVDSDAPSIVLGYYALSAAQIDLAELGDA